MKAGESYQRSPKFETLKRRPSKHGPLVWKGVELTLENLPMHVTPIYNNCGRGYTTYKGICYNHVFNQWRASLWMGKGTPPCFLGSYDNEYAAGCIYAWAYSIMHGEEKASEARKLGE